MTVTYFSAIKSDPCDDENQIGQKAKQKLMGHLNLAFEGLSTSQIGTLKMSIFLNIQYCLYWMKPIPSF